MIKKRAEQSDSFSVQRLDRGAVITAVLAGLNRVTKHTHQSCREKNASVVAERSFKRRFGTEKRVVAERGFKRRLGTGKRVVAERVLKDGLGLENGWSQNRVFKDG